MKRRHSGYILAVVVMSVCSHVAHIVSEMTQSWVVAETVPEVSISYGLYQGSMVVRSNSNCTEDRLVLTITCLVYMNVCAWSCQSSDSLRRKQILTLYNTGKLLYPCTSAPPLSSPSLARVRESFIDAVVWLATVVAVVLSGLVSLVALTLSAYNVNHTPRNFWLSLRGLYFWFGTSCVLSLLALATWGIEFYFKLTRNVGTVDTIAGLLISNEKAQLGCSYWSQLAVVGLHGGCMALLYYRETLFDKRPPFVGSLQRQNNSLNYTNYLYLVFLYFFPLNFMS